MSSPTFDLSKVQYTSVANSFKNDGKKYSGSLTLSGSISSGSFLISSTTITVATTPQFSTLYAFFQEFEDAAQQFFVGSGYNTAKWYATSINSKLGIVVTTSGNAGVIDGLIYPVINGTTITINAIVNNPYSNSIAITTQTIPFTFFNYTLTN